MTVFLTEQILFTHVPKTAGTTVRHFIESHFAPEGIFPPMLEVDRDPFLYHKIEHAKAFPKAMIQQALLVRSHIPYHEMLALLDMKPLTLTMLRNPLRRALSEIFHFRRNGDAYLRELPLEVMVRDHSDTYRPSWSYFGKDVEKAIETVLTFDWLGIQEMFEPSMEMLCRMMGWRVPSGWGKENTMPGEQSGVPVSMAVLDMLSERLYDDMRFYTVAREAFMDRLAADQVKTPARNAA